MKYSEIDATEDSILLLSEVIDFDMHWIGVDFLPSHKKHAISISKLDDDCSADTTMLVSMMSLHMENLRFLKYASEALDIEIFNQSLNLKTIFKRDDEISVTNVTDTDKHETMTNFSDSPFRVQFPYSLRVSDISDIERMLQRHESMESKNKQLKKDVERDRILINGVRIVGSEVGMQGICDRIGIVCDKVLKECAISILDKTFQEELTQIILSKASRTHSGGITFQALQSVIDPTQSMLLPQSEITPPIRVKLYVGAFPPDPLLPNSERKWGLICAITCESFFEVQQHLTLQEDDLMNPNHYNDHHHQPITEKRDKTIIKSVYEDVIMVEAQIKSNRLFESIDDGYAYVYGTKEKSFNKFCCVGPILGKDIDTGVVTLSVFLN